ncbi:DEAD/DEAH box helicase, partial [bacterium]|nr:DEAD/DEAH box helicase [bacterium]
MQNLDTTQTFAQFALPPELHASLDAMEFKHPTPVQSASIPPALEGRDVLGTAQTGTGKTGAFAVPMLAALFQNRVRQALILCPTRELAAQIHMVLRKMGRQLKVNGSLVVGGESFYRQISELKRGADYIVATPGRLNDHLEEGTVELSNMGMLVLDEVDRMLDMGFAPQIKQILQHVPQERQTLLFSATLPPEIQRMSKEFLKDPVRVEVGSVEEVASQVTETTVRVNEVEKNDILLGELESRTGKVLIFTRTKSRADRLGRLLFQRGHSTVTLHGGCTQGQRKFALANFRDGSARIMVATDLAGRGIDVHDIEHVINYDLPAGREDYIHRIGRTGRFGREGAALNLLNHGDRDGERIVYGKPQGRSKGSSHAPARGAGGSKRGGFGAKREGGFGGRREGGFGGGKFGKRPFQNRDAQQLEGSERRESFSAPKREKLVVVESQEATVQSVENLVDTAVIPDAPAADTVDRTAKKQHAKTFGAKSAGGFRGDQESRGPRREGFKPRHAKGERFAPRGEGEGFPRKEGGFRSREGGFAPRE